MQNPPLAQPALQRAGRPPEKPLTANLVARRWLVLRKTAPGMFKGLVDTYTPDVVVCFTQADTDAAELVVQGTRTQVLRVWPESMAPTRQLVGTFQLAGFRNHESGLLAEDLSVAPLKADIVMCPYWGDPMRQAALRDYIARSRPVLCVRGTQAEPELERKTAGDVAVNVLSARGWAAVEINGSDCRLIAAG